MFVSLEEEEEEEEGCSRLSLHREKQQTVKNQFDKMHRRLRFHKYQTFLKSRGGKAPYFAHDDRGAFATFVLKKSFYCMSHSCGSSEQVFFSESFFGGSGEGYACGGGTLQNCGFYR